MRNPPARNGKEWLKEIVKEWRDLYFAASNLHQDDKLEHNRCLRCLFSIIDKHYEG